MLWLQVMGSLRDHPKMRRLAKDLGCEEAHAIGHLVSLWLWCLERAQDGRFEGADAADDVEVAAGWRGEAGAFVASAVRRGLLERDGDMLCVHDWDEHAGSLREAREAKERRDRRRNSAGSGGNGAERPDASRRVATNHDTSRGIPLTGTGEGQDRSHTSPRAGEPETAPEPNPASPEGEPPPPKLDPLDLPNTMHAADVERALRQSGMDLEVMGVNRDRLSRLCPVRLEEYQSALNATLGNAASPCAAYLLRCIEAARSKPVKASGTNGGQRAPPRDPRAQAPVSDFSHIPPGFATVGGVLVDMRAKGATSG